MDISEIPIDTRVIEIIKDDGIETLYPPQADAIPIIMKGKNLLLSIPTASGKSLVAYIAMIHKLLQKSGKALYVVPLIALAKEKYEELKKFEELGLKVGISTGDLDDSDPRLSRYDIIVCTSEKADSLLRHKISWLQDIGVLVIDEIHLIHDATRGPTLEVLIAQFQALIKEIQIIGLSATIANATEMAIWLNATLIQSDWRPVPLSEGVYYKDEISFENGTKSELAVHYKEPLFQLVKDSLDKNGQVLIFVNSRRSTSSVAKKLTSVISDTLTEKEKESLQGIVDKIKRQHAEQTKIDTQLFTCIKHGVAFHHAGLASYQRRIIEDYFKQGKIRCIVATPTLAAGVNVPAKRVIIRDLWRYDPDFGMKPIPVLEYKQQAGRAGRPRYDTFGEAITIAKDENQKNQIFQLYIHGEVEQIYSKLGNQAALRMHLLATIATGFVHNIDEVYSFIDKTFYAYQTESYSLHGTIDETIDFLKENEFITIEQDQFIPTLFGIRTSSLYIDPLSAVEIKKAFESSQSTTFSALSFLHVISSTPDVRSLYLRKSDSWIEQELEGLEDELLIKPPPAYEPDYEWFLSDMKTAFLLNDWINEKSEDYMISKYGVGPGDIHGIVDTANWLLHATREIGRMYHFESVSFLTKLLLRVKNGCKDELLSLISLKGIGRVRARSLFKAGFKSVHDLRKVNINQIAQVKTIGPRIAENIKRQIGEESKFVDPMLSEFHED
jgi:ATP-dependent DNA helicase